MTCKVIDEPHGLHEHPARRSVAPTAGNPMRLFVRAAFLLAGLVNLYPLTGVLGAGALEALYGRGFAEPELLLLMRHRAVLFGLLGGLLVAAAWRPAWRGPATLAGLVSMLSFVALAGPPQELAAALGRVYLADIVASALLLAGWWLSGRAGVVDAERRRDRS